MACKVIRSEDGTVVGIVCGSPWGIGTYKYGEDEDGNDERIYGFPPSEMNPHDFDPDRECCTAAEIKAWEDACAEFDAAKAG